MGHAVRYAGMLGGLGGRADTYPFNFGNLCVCYLNKPDCFIWEFKQNTIFSIMSILEECNSRLICAHKTQSMPLWLHFYKNITYVHVCKHSNPMHKSAHWQTHTHVMPLYLDSLAALWTLCSLFSKYRLIYAPCCLSEHIGHSIFSPITFYHSDCEWLRHTGVHLKVLLRITFPLSTWQYIRNTVNFPVIWGPDKISSRLYWITLPSSPPPPPPPPSSLHGFSQQQILRHKRK